MCPLRLHFEHDHDPGSRLAIEGGQPVRIEPWPSYDKGFSDIGEDEIEAVVQVLRRKRLFRYDDRSYSDTEAGQFEREFASHFKSRYALSCTSGTAAIALALFALGIKPGDKVVCPAFTFAATPSAIRLAGAIPMIVDSDADLQIDLGKLAEALSGDVRAVIVVHMRGYAAPVRAIVDLANERGIPVIEDAVPALGVALDGQHLGTFGAIGCFSTQSDKAINTGEGGVLITNSKDIYARAIVLSGAYEGRIRGHLDLDGDPQIDLKLPLFSLRMDEMRAAVARVQLRSLDARVLRFQNNFEAVVQALRDVDGLTIREPLAKGAYLGESLIFRVDFSSEDVTSRFAAALKAEGIDCRILGDDDDRNVRCAWNWKFLFDGAPEEDVQAKLPVSTRLLKRSIDVPLSMCLTVTDRRQLIEALQKVCWTFRERRKDGADSGVRIDR